VPDELEREIERESSERGKSWSAAALELLEEAVRMRRAPGIVFADGPAGRRAVVAGSGVDVWEIVAASRQGDRDYDALKRDFSWLSEAQLRAALAYYELYPEEIDVRLEREELWTPERTWRKMPFTRPRGKESLSGDALPPR
jgi:uncharacterized protein (DUF433 family)